MVNMGEEVKDMNAFLDFLKKNKFLLVLLVVVVLIGAVGGFFVLFRSGPIPYLLKNVSLFPEPLEKSKNFQGSVEEGEDSLIYPEEKFDLNVIKSAFIELVVEEGKFMEIWNRIIFSAKEFSGFVSNSTFSKQDKHYSGTITLLIPSKDLDSFINKISDFGDVENTWINSKDVTGEYVDLSSRLKVLETQRDLLLSWLNEAKDIKDMLAIRGELDRIETEIEKIKGRMNYIAFHTDFSQVSISIREKGKKVGVVSPILRKILEVLNRALNGLIISIFAIIIVAAWLIPWLILAYIIYLIYKKRSTIS